MIRNSFLLIILAGIAAILYPLFAQYTSPETLNGLAAFYVTQGPSQTGAANMVTSIVVTYRGLDTLGEVTILFLTAAIVGFMLKSAGEKAHTEPIQSVSPILSTASSFLVPLTILFGVYIFINGHLTPGGGFQGGAITASAFLLMILAEKGHQIGHHALAVTESISGFGFVVLGLAGLAFAGGFLDSSFLPGGVVGTLISAGAIPLIYILIGLKVGAEITTIILELNQTKENTK